MGSIKRDIGNISTENNAAGKSPRINAYAGQSQAGTRGYSLNSYFPEDRKAEAEQSLDPDDRAIRNPSGPSRPDENVNAGFIVALDNDNLVNSIILSEILGRPKSMLKKGRW